MQMPANTDTIVAVSTAWQSASLAIVRLSGVESFGLLHAVGVTPPAVRRPTWTHTELQLGDGLALPATAFWFPAPRSYTGQDVVELHTVGALPLVRELAASLIEHGARRALPGEFTARAFLAGRLDARQVEGVLQLMRCEHEAGARQAARLLRGARHSTQVQSLDRLTQLLARIEAGIDFVEEEDVRFATPSEVVAALDELRHALAAETEAEPGEVLAGKPHVALVGLPNAGKSALFNALVGYERALVSPVLGTTRDVLSAEALVAGMPVVFQDCAGLGDSTDELELATHRATERAAEHADLVLWVHAADVGWSQRETEVCHQIEPQRCVRVRSKADLSGDSSALAAGSAPAASVDVSIRDPESVARLRTVLAGRLQRIPSQAAGGASGGEFRAAAEALRRARALAARGDERYFPAELVALELREAYNLLSESSSRDLDEEVLGRVFAEFCVGK